MNVGFVILHYLTDNDTIECINSIFEKCDNRINYNIDVVDNFSNNGSIEKVEEYFKDNKKIHIIKNEKNLGFARGNNVGYRYCREELKCDYIMILNNDILIDSDNLFEKIEKNYNKYNCAVIGPDIVSMVDGGHQNPIESDNYNRLNIIYTIIRYIMLYILSIMHLYDILKRNKDKDETKKKSINKLKEIIEGKQLHGAFLIFTPKFITKMEEAFFPKTFLYLEENILYKKCLNNNLKTLYDPNIKVYHKEDSSTNFLCINNKKKREFVFKNLIKSHIVLLLNMNKL